MRDLVINFERNLNQFTYDELVYLNRRIVSQLKQMQKARSLISMSNFAMGERIWFEHDGRRINGRIIRFNVKTVTILADDNHQWNVAPGLLRKHE